MSEILSQSSQKSEPYMVLLSKTDVEKVAEYLQTSTDEVKKAFKKRTSKHKLPIPEDLNAERDLLLQKLKDFDKYFLLRLLSEKYQKTVQNYLKMDPSNPHKNDLHTRLKNNIFIEVQRAMTKDLRHRTVVYILCFENTLEKDMAIRSIARLFTKG